MGFHFRYRIVSICTDAQNCGSDADSLLHTAEVFGGNFLLQLPDDVHGSAARVPDIAGLPKEGLRGCAGCVFLELTDKQKNAAVLRDVMDVPLTRG